MKKIYLWGLLCVITQSVLAQKQFHLEECIESAVANNRMLQNAVIEIERSKEQKSVIYTKYFPKISANISAFQAFDKLLKGDGTYPQKLAALEPLMPGISQMVGQPIDFAEIYRGYVGTISVMQPIYTGGQIHTGNRLCSLEQDIMQLQLGLKEREIIEKVTENYWQIAKLMYNLQTLDAADRQIGCVCEQVSQFVKAGVTTSNDLLKVKLRQQELKSKRLKVENGIRVLKLLLGQQCGIKDNFNIVLTGAEEILLQECIDASAKANSRIEYQLAEKAVEAERLQIKMEQAKCLPTIAVGVIGMNYGFGGLSSRVSKYINTNITNGLVMGTVSVPISEWWTGKKNIRRQKLKLKEAQNNRDEALEMLTIDIESAWLNLQEAIQQVEVARTSVTQSKENLCQSTSKYQAGTETLTDLLDAETLHRQSQNNLSSAFASYHVALKKYQLKVK